MAWWLSAPPETLIEATSPNAFFKKRINRYQTHFWPNVSSPSVSTQCFAVTALQQQIAAKVHKCRRRCSAQTTAKSLKPTGQRNVTRCQWYTIVHHDATATIHYGGQQIHRASTSTPSRPTAGKDPCSNTRPSGAASSSSKKYLTGSKLKTKKQLDSTTRG